MPRDPHDLTAGEWAVLALLAEAPSHGFALARAMGPDGVVGRVWSVRRPLVYRAVDTLTAMGHVRPGLESTTAALRFVETVLHAPVPSAMLTARTRAAGLRAGRQ